MPSTLPALLLSGGAVIDLDGSLLIQLAIFFVAFELLRRLVFRPMIALFDAREAAIDGAKREARSLETEAEEKLKAFETEMKKVRAEAAADRDSIRQDAQRLERELLAKARVEADGMLGDATAKMQSDAAAIRADMKKTVPALAGQIAEKLLGRKAA
ncbi:ATP synthase F0 subunit B [Sandaracinus amylolyticus]|uniref:ATP synthase subunit b n=1 Tax=Sandaracinus amylolyticus TaxID=927083 RepID=A0A0F6W244_9BACT|nr:ATP synthase F0 subunit B [Sandaracinus amylolyticus]AKF05461.1 ATP synthase F0 sector subunit b' [Sandaracinus amylolyticus]